MDAERDILFHRTAEGARACESALPDAHREVLLAVGELTHFDAIASRLAHRPIDEIVSCLDDLEAIGLVESMPVDWLVEAFMLELHELDALLDSTPSR
jgi:hypothetical protein